LATESGTLTEEAMSCCKIVVHFVASN